MKSKVLNLNDPTYADLIEYADRCMGRIDKLVDYKITNSRDGSRVLYLLITLYSKASISRGIVVNYLVSGSESGGVSFGNSPVHNED